MVYRLMVGLAAVGVERILMMPAASGLYDSLERTLRSHVAAEKPSLPELELLEMTIRHTARDTVDSVEEMVERGVSAIVVLGGDGTNRIVARHCSDVPLCTLSTGTNNAFPRMREATVAGLATGLVATGQTGDEALRREKILRVALNGDHDHDCALVDVAVSAERFVGARALWQGRGHLGGLRHLRLPGRGRPFGRGRTARPHPPLRRTRPPPQAHRPERCRVGPHRPPGARPRGAGRHRGVPTPRTRRRGRARDGLRQRRTRRRAGDRGRPGRPRGGTPGLPMAR